jgi:hypothetical protein
MTDADLNKAIEVAEEAVAGFADDDSFEQLLALAVLELRDRLNNEREACAKIAEEPWQGSPKAIAEQIRAKGQE